MKPIKLLIVGLAIAAGMLAPCHGKPRQISLLETRAKLEGAKLQAEDAAAGDPTKADLAAVAADKSQALTDFDAEYTEKFGPDWINRWQNSSYENDNDEAVDIYINHGPFPWAEFGCVSNGKQSELLAHIASKPVLVAEDTLAVRSASVASPLVFQRLDELAVHISSQGVHDEEYYAYKHLSVLKKDTGGIGRRGFTKHMSVDEWLDLASANAPMSPHTFASMRNHLLIRTAKLLILKRRAENLPAEGPEFDAAFTPVIAALRAPKFAGLNAAVTALGLDLAIPAPDFTAQETVAAAVAPAAVNKGDFLTSWGEAYSYHWGLGSVMFVMGEGGYEAWRAGILAAE